MMMKMSKAPTLAAVATMAIFSGHALFAQAAGPSASVHGHVTNPAGQNFGAGEVKFTKDRTVATADLKFAANMVFPIDAQGNYKATGITPGEYFVFFDQGDKVVDRLDLVIKPTDTDITLDDDQSRAEYLKTMTPEQLKALDEYKKKNAAIVSSNAVVGNLNATLKTVRADLTAAAPTKGDVSADVAKMKEATAAKPDESILWINYGDTLNAQGDHLAVADKAAGKPAATDPDVMQMYADAVDAYKKGIDLDVASKKPNPANQAGAYNQMGNAYKNENKMTEAVAAFDSAAKTMPANAGMYYKNEAAVMYNSGKMDEAAAAADKALAVDPNIADAYFIKGQALVTKVTVDPKTNKITAPPGCVDAYQKFLELAPNDPKVPQVKEVLTSLGEKITTKYKAGK
jgi:tetratricopeptide (TPR) repeat protein